MSILFRNLFYIFIIIGTIFCQLWASIWPAKAAQSQTAEISQEELVTGAQQESSTIPPIPGNLI